MAEALAEGEEAFYSVPDEDGFYDMDDYEVGESEALLKEQSEELLKQVKQQSMEMSVWNSAASNLEQAERRLQEEKSFESYQAYLDANEAQWKAFKDVGWEREEYNKGLRAYRNNQLRYKSLGPRAQEGLYINQEEKLHGDLRQYAERQNQERIRYEEQERINQERKEPPPPTAKEVVRQQVAERNNLWRNTNVDEVLRTRQQRYQRNNATLRKWGAGLLTAGGVLLVNHKRKKAKKD
jgi:hypothetical protein